MFKMSLLIVYVDHPFMALNCLQTYTKIFVFLFRTLLFLPVASFFCTFTPRDDFLVTNKPIKQTDHETFLPTDCRLPAGVICTGARMESDPDGRPDHLCRKRNLLPDGYLRRRGTGVCLACLRRFGALARTRRERAAVDPAEGTADLWGEGILGSATVAGGWYLLFDLYGQRTDGFGGFYLLDGSFPPDGDPAD